MAGENDIYKFLKENNLTTKDEATFTKEYSDPKKAEELHKFFVENELTTKDSTAFYDTYFKKKDGTVVAPKPANVSTTGVSPTLSPSKKEAPKNSNSGFYNAVGGDIVAPVGTFGPNTTKPQSLSDAHSEDKNWGGNLWNKFLKGGESIITGATDAVFNTMIDVLPESVVGAKSEDAKKLYREEVIPKAIDGKLVNAIGANVTPQEQENFDKGVVSSAIGGLAQTIPAMVTPKGTKAMALFMQAYDGALKSINSTEEGAKLPESTKTIFSLSVGTAQAALEKVGLDKIFGKMSTKVATKLVAKSIAELAKKSVVPITAEMVDQAIIAASKTLKDKVVKAGGKIAGGALVEFATGSAQEIATMLAENEVNKRSGREVFEETSFGDKVKRVATSGAMEAIGGGILGVAALPFSKTRNYIAEKVSEAKTPEDIVALKAEMAGPNMKLSDEQLNKIEETIDNYVRVNSKIPESVANRKEVVEQVMEREEIENELAKKEAELEKTDEAFKPEIKKEIEVLNSRVSEINGQIKESSEEPAIVVGSDGTKIYKYGETKESHAPIVIHESKNGNKIYGFVHSDFMKDENGNMRLFKTVEEAKNEAQKILDGATTGEINKPISENAGQSEGQSDKGPISENVAPIERPNAEGTVSVDGEAVESDTHLKVSADAKTAIKDGIKKQVIETDENGKPVVREVEFTAEDADVELDRLEALAKKGKLTPEEFQRSYFGQRSDTSTFKSASDQIGKDAVGFIKKLRDSFETPSKTDNTDGVQNILDNATYQPRSDRNVIIRLPIDKVLKIQEVGENVARGQNGVDSRIDRIKKFLSGKPKNLEASLLNINKDNTLGIDGRHRLEAAKEMGATHAMFEIKKTDEQSLRDLLGENKSENKESKTDNTVVGESKGADVDFTAKGGNKVVDESGEPITVYHTSKDENIKEFKTSGEIETLGGMVKNEGAYFTPNKGEYSHKGGKEYEVEISIKNPFITTDQKESAIISPEKKAELISKGHDGVILMRNGKADEYVVFDKSQIKEKQKVGNDYTKIGKPLQDKAQAEFEKINGVNEEKTTNTTDIPKPTEKEGIADEKTNTDSGGTKEKPPSEPPPAEPKEPVAEGEDDGVVAFKKAEFQAARDRLGINEFVDEGKTTHVEESAKAQKTIDDWRKEGTYAENIGDIQKRAALGKINTQEQFIFAKHLADLDATVNSIKDVNSKEYDSALKEYRNAVDAADKARSEFGRQLGMVAKNHGEIRTVADVMVRMMDDNLVDVLTPEQKAEAKKRFDELDAKVKEAEKVTQEYEQKVKDLQAELEFERAKKEVQREKSGRTRPKTKDQFKAERDNIKKSIADKWRGAGNDNTLSVTIPYAKQFMAIAPEVGKLIKSYIDEGRATTLEGVRKLLKQDLEEAKIPVTDEEVRAFIAGKYNEKKLARGELSRKISEIKQEEKLLLAIEDIENGKEPEGERAKVERNQKLKDLRDKLENLKKQAGVGRYSEDARFETAAKARITANNKLKEQFEEKLRKGDFAPDPQKQSIIENNELQKRHPELFKKVIKAQNERYEAQLNFEKKSIEDKMKNWSVGRKALHGLDIALTTAKGSVAMVDQSAVFVQALLYTGGHPLKAAKFAGTALRDLINSNRFDAAMFKLHNSHEWQLIEKSGLAMFEPHTPKAELRNELHGGDKNFFNKNIGIPEIKKLGIKGWDATIKGHKLSPGKALERSVSTYLNNARLDLFHKQVKSGIEAGKTFENDPDFFKGAARVANELTGHGKVHSMIDQATGEGLNKIIWSPKMFASSLNMIGVGDMVNAMQGKKGFYASLSGQQRMFVAKQIGRFIGMGAVAYAAAKAMGGDADLDPRSSAFGTIKVGEYDIPLFGRYGSVIRTIIQVAMAAKKNKDGSINIIGDKYGEETPMEALGKSFIRGKMTPLAGLAYDVANRKGNTYTHEKITPTSALQSQVIPMAFGDIKDIIKNDPSISGVAASLALIYGLNVRNEKVSDAKFEAIKAANAADKPSTGKRAKRTERTKRATRK